MLPGDLLIDPMTGAYSRAVLQQRLQEEVDRSSRYQLPFSLLFVDLDHFKSINDAFGHTFGDQIIIEFVNRLRGMVRASDILIRYGGDEFVILLPNTPKDQAISMAERLITGIQSKPFSGEPPLSLKISIGVSTYPEDGQNPETLFEEADLRQYEAKRRGRGRVVAENPSKAHPLPFDETMRLVDRDDALTTANRFLNQLPEVGRGILQIIGKKGSGKTRFLGEVGKIARLRGFEVVSLRGSQTLASRNYSILLEGFSGWNLPSPYAGVQAFADALEMVLVDNDRMGLFIAADNIIDFDWATLDLLRHLFVIRSIPLIALAFTSGPEASQRSFLPEAPLYESVRMQPFSQDELRVWLRSMLRWEPQDEFLLWLYQFSNGYPGTVRAALAHLYDHGILKRSETSWSIDSSSLQSMSPEQLGLPAAPSDHNMPSLPTSFIGRDQEIQQVKQLIRERRLVTLLGPGGVGKTRLALQAANEIVEQYTHGVCFVPLASINSPQFMFPAIAGALKFSFFSQETPEVQLTNYLREKHLLLVLDNFEQLVEAGDLISKILENAPHVSILVTSRERLSIPGETCMEIKGMGYPTNSLEGMEVFPAVQVFLMNARQVDANFQMTPEDRAHVARICQLVEGLPLGIEMAAAWVKLLSCAEIAREIDKNLDFLITELRNIPSRHRSLRGVFEHSWSLLSDQEKSSFSKLAVFMGGFGREAADEVAGAKLPILSALSNKSLLSRTSSGRYVIHEVLKQYAAEKLSSDPEEYRTAHEAHCRYYSNFLAQRAEELRGGRQKESLADIQNELNNIRSAGKYALDSSYLEPINNMIGPLGLFYLMRCYYQEGREIFSKAVQVYRAAGLTGDATFGKLLLEEAVFHVRLSDHDEAELLLREALVVFKSTGDECSTGETYHMLGVLAEETSDHPQAIEYCQKSIQIARNVGNSFGLADALTELGIIHWLTGEYAKSKQIFDEALEICREHKNRWLLSRALINLANINSELNRDDEAYSQFSEALNITIEMGDKIGRSILLNNMGDLEMSRGNFKTALPLLEESLQISEEAGDRFGMTTPLDNLADIAMAQHQYDKARRLLHKSLTISRGIGSTSDEAFTISHLALLETACGEYDEARKTFTLALQHAREHNTNPISLEVIENIAEYLSTIGHQTAAQKYLRYVLEHPSLASWTRSRAVNILHSPTQISPQSSPGKQDASIPEIQQVLVELSKLLE
jgi:diguanylate cyclase (GGDEF)-like protein